MNVKHNERYYVRMQIEPMLAPHTHHGAMFFWLLMADALAGVFGAVGSPKDVSVRGQFFAFRDVNNFITCVYF